MRWGCYLPFPLVTSSPPFYPYNRDTSITLLTLRVKGQSHFLAFFVPFFPGTDPLSEVKASCHLNSHQFTRGEGAVSVGNPTYYLSFPPPSPTHRADWQCFALRKLYIKMWRRSRKLNVLFLLWNFLQFALFMQSKGQTAIKRSSRSHFRQHAKCNVTTTNYYIF